MPAESSCPACGIYFMKWGQPARSADRSDDEYDLDEQHGLIGELFQPLDKMDSAAFYGRCAALAMLGVWSWFLFGYDYRDGAIFGSFMHNILLPIHETGHVLFRLFGEFMMFLGGSLFQLLLPFGIGVAFFVMRRDNFGAAVCVWWTGVSLVDLAPYIYDALHPQLMLISGTTGAEGGPHDWIYLLNALNQLGRAQMWGALAHVVGGVVMFAALIWGTLIMLRQRSRLGESVE